jgi:hypothetical protein
MDIGLQVALGIGVAKDYTQGGTVSREQAIADREAEIQAFEARIQQRRRITNPASADRGTPMSKTQNVLGKTAQLLATFQSALEAIRKDVIGVRDSTQKAFDGVASDMKNALLACQRFNERISRQESKAALLAEMIERLEKRLGTAEAKIARTELEAVPVSFMGYEAYIRATRVVLTAKHGAIDAFELPSRVIDLQVQPYGLLITVEGGDKYLLCGGPTPASMFLNFYSKGTPADVYGFFQGAQDAEEERD